MRLSPSNGENSNGENSNGEKLCVEVTRLVFKLSASQHFSNNFSPLRRIQGVASMFAQLISNEDGATAIEYGLIPALISLAAAIAFQSLDLNLANIFFRIIDAMAGR